MNYQAKRKHDGVIVIDNYEGRDLYAVRAVPPVRFRGASAFIYGPPLVEDGRRGIVAMVDDQGTEVWPNQVGAPGYWSWLLDLAVEAGLELY